MKREPGKGKPERKDDGAGTAGEEATGQIPATRARNRSAEKAKEQSGEGPARGVGNPDECD